GRESDRGERGRERGEKCGARDENRGQRRGPAGAAPLRRRDGRAGIELGRRAQERASKLGERRTPLGVWVEASVDRGAQRHRQPAPVALERGDGLTDGARRRRRGRAEDRVAPAPTLVQRQGKGV